VVDGHEVVALVGKLRCIADGPAHAQLIADCLCKLDLFRLSKQMDALDAVLSGARGCRAGGCVRGQALTDGSRHRETLKIGSTCPK
jgi:hypothetical protein